MQKTNLILFLKRFSKRDWREFRKFVQSPYFNKREDVVQLFTYLEGAIKKLALSDLDRREVFKAIYPKEQFSEKRLRHTTSVLLKLVKRYLIQLELENDTISSQQYYYQALREKDLAIFFEKEWAAANTLLDKSPHRDGAFYFQKYKLELEGLLYTMSQRRTGEMNFQNVSDQLTISYVSGILRLCTQVQSHQTLSEQVYDLKLLKQVLDFIAEGGYEEVPVVSLYYQGYKSIECLELEDLPNSELHFQKLKSLIAQYWQLFPSLEMSGFYLLAINYCIRRMNAGERHFVREAFELFRSALANGVLLQNGIFSSFSYKNITRLGMALSENDWVEQFLEDYKKHLHPRERENTWRYNLAYFYFQQQKYKSAMPLLLQVELKDVLNNLDARRMLLKSYFELDEFNALESLLDSFAGYLRRQKDIGYHRKNNLNLIRFVRKIMQERKGDKKAHQKLKAEMEKTKWLAEREWLMEKVEL